MTILKKRRILITIAISTVAVCCAAYGIWFLLSDWGYTKEIPLDEQQKRQVFLDTAQEWLGYNGADQSHQQIIDLYNAHEPLAQGYQVQYDDKWCATFVSATAIQCGYTSIVPTECSCERQIDLFKQLSRWDESDSYVPLPGDIIYYSSQDNGIGDCDTWSDHVGIVFGTRLNWIKVLEGNNQNAVRFRYIHVNAVTIRGYGLPDYASLS